MERRVVSGAESREWMARVRCSTKELKVISLQLSIMFDSGVPLLESLEILAQQAERPELTEVLWTVHQSLLEGHRLSRALGQFPRIFGPDYINLIKVAENTGQLSLVFDRLAGTLERREELMRKVWSALTYPLVLLFITLLGLFLFTVYVVPTLKPLLEIPGFETPAPTKVLFFFSNILQHPLTLLPLLLAPGIFYLLYLQLKNYLAHHPLKQIAAARATLSIPVIGSLLTRLALTRALDTLALNLEAGMPMTDSLVLAGDVSGHLAFKYRFRQTAEALKTGVGFEEAFSEPATIPGEAVAMLVVGEESGKIPLMARAMAKLYREAVEYDLARATTLLEPLLMAFLGLLTTFVALSTALPTIRLLQVL